MELIIELRCNIRTTIEKVTVFLDHEVCIENVTIRFVQRLSLAFLLNLLVDVYGLNGRDHDAVFGAISLRLALLGHRLPLPMCTAVTRSRLRHTSKFTTRLFKKR